MTHVIKDWEEPAWWYEHPLPRRWHRCHAVNMADVDGTFVGRCPCGGMWIGGKYIDGVWVSGGWTGKNSRRKRNR